MFIPAITVIITTHKRPELLIKAVASVYAQQWPPQALELIIIHDGPDTEGSYEALQKQFGTSRRKIDLKFLTTEKHHGKPSILRNRAAEQASGQVFSFLDDDNLYLPNHIQELWAKMSEGYDVVYGKRTYTQIDINPNNFMGEMIMDVEQLQDNVLEDRNFIDTSDLMITKRALYDIGGWNEEQRRYLDWELVYRLWKAGMRFGFADKVLTSYVWHEEGLTRKEPNTMKELEYREFLKTVIIYQDWLDRRTF